MTLEEYLTYHPDDRKYELLAGCVVLPGFSVRVRELFEQ